MRRVKALDALALALLATLLLTGCAKLGGTEAGNPAQSSEMNNTPTSAFSPQILGSICFKLDECFASVSQSICEASVKDLTNLADRFGLSPSFGRFKEVIAAEEAKTLRANVSQALTCIQEIRLLSCASAPVTSAYTDMNPNNYAAVLNLIPTSSTSCAGVF